MLRKADTIVWDAAGALPVPRVTATPILVFEGLCTGPPGEEKGKVGHCGGFRRRYLRSEEISLCIG